MNEEGEIIMKYQEIRCQEVTCPYGKQPGQRCILGEVCVDDLDGHAPVRERHKCPKAKQGQLQFVTVILKTA